MLGAGEWRGAVRFWRTPGPAGRGTALRQHKPQQFPPGLIAVGYACAGTLTFPLALAAALARPTNSSVMARHSTGFAVVSRNTPVTVWPGKYICWSSSTLYSSIGSSGVSPSAATARSEMERNMAAARRPAGSREGKHWYMLSDARYTGGTSRMQ